MDTNQTPKRALGEILVKRGSITEAQLSEALAAQRTSMLPVGSTLIRLGHASEGDVALALAEQFGLPGVCPSACTVDLEVLRFIPREIAVSHRILAVASSGGDGLGVAFSKPHHQGLLDELAFASARSILPFLAPRATLETAIQAAYDAWDKGETRWKGPRSTHDEPHLEVVQLSVEITPELESETSPLDAFPNAPAARTRAPGDRPLVLVVDDEPEILEILSLTLEAKGFEVKTADRGRKALELLREVTPDLIILDAMLPEIHGFELCSHIKQAEHLKHVPVIIISAIYTGWNYSQDVRRMYGADDYIEKPFSPKEVARRVQLQLAEHEGQTASSEREQARQRAVHAVKKGFQCLQEGDVEGALELADFSVRTDPFEPRSHFVLASALNAAGRFYEAISAYERVVDLAPEQFSAQKNLAVLYERQGFKAKAVEMWMRALDNSPSDAVRQTVKAHLVDLL